MDESEEGSDNIYTERRETEFESEGEKGAWKVDLIYRTSGQPLFLSLSIHIISIHVSLSI